MSKRLRTVRSEDISELSIRCSCGFETVIKIDSTLEPAVECPKCGADWSSARMATRALKELRSSAAAFVAGAPMPEWRIEAVGRACELRIIEEE